MSDMDLCYLPATKAIELFKARKLSPVELMAAVISRAEDTAKTINCFAYTHFDEAMDGARKAEARYAKSARTGLLEGLPVAVKDESYIKGKPTSFGSLPYRDYVPDNTSVVNARILKAGGIVHGRTTTPEMSCAAYTWSRLWGLTRNPWNPDFTPGGSSGGTAASLADGSSTIGTGSDIGGSIRIPSSACGLVGFKPPYGRNPSDHPLNLDFYCHTGPMARTVSDTILLQNNMAGPSPDDIATVRPKLTLPTRYEPIKGWKIAYSIDLGFYEVDLEVRANTLRAVEVFHSLGAEVEEVDLGWTRETLDASITYLRHLFGGLLVPILNQHADDMTTYCRAFAEAGKMSKAEHFAATFETANRMYQTLGPLLEKYRVLICPTTALPAVKADFDQSRDVVRINDVEVDPFLGWVMTSPFNMMSRCPVLSVPSGQASNRIPTGIQIVGRTFCDADVFRAGLAYETALGGWFNSPDKRPSGINGH